MNDINECKGRKQRKVFENNLRTFKDVAKDNYHKSRVEAGDKNFTKFLEKKERASAHHWDKFHVWLFVWYWAFNHHTNYNSLFNNLTYILN